MVRSIRARLNFNRSITPQQAAFIRRHRDVFPTKLYPDDFLDRITKGQKPELELMPPVSSNFPFEPGFGTRDFVEFATGVAFLRSRKLIK